MTIRILLVALILVVGWNVVQIAGAMAPAGGLHSQQLLGKLRNSGRAGANGFQVQAASVTGRLPGVPFLQVKSENSTPETPPSPVIADGSRDNPRIVRLRQGESAQLQCEVVGMPTPMAYWTRNDLVILRGQNGETGRLGGNLVEAVTNIGRSTLEHAATIAKLRFSCVTEADAGLYECHGSNGVERLVAYTKVIVEPEGKPRANECIPPAQTEDSLSVATPPFIYMYTDMRLEYPGNDVQLLCRANGRPAPTIQWFDSNDIPIKNGHNFTVLSNGDLLVRRIDFGMREPFRQFSCKAKNSVGRDTAVVDLLAVAQK